MGVLANDELLELQFGLPYAPKAYFMAGDYRNGSRSKKEDEEWETITAMIKRSIELGLTECGVERILSGGTVYKLKLLGYKVSNSYVGATIRWD